MKKEEEYKQDDHNKHDAFLESKEVNVKNIEDIKSEFKKVDREEEDRLVQEYRETEDETILSYLYELREPTIRVWARKYFYLGDSEDDVVAEFRGIWMRCIRQYKYEPEVRAVRTKKGGFVLDEDGNRKTRFKRTPFNTFLYSAFRNHVSNVIKKKYSKKRVNEEGIPHETMMKSLDYEYDGDDGGGQTLYDVVASNNNDHESSFDAENIISAISNGDKDIEEALRRFAYDKKISKITTACRLCKGEISINPSQQKTVIKGGEKANNLVKKLIQDSGRYDKDFKITSYQVFRSKVVYEIYGKDTKLMRKVMKALQTYKDTYEI